jgi:uncharacterized protein (TIGR02646 family)
LLFFEKSQPAPACLAQEKEKASGDYKCGDVLPRLQADFKNKCYLCEREGMTSINVEHFRPHKGDTDLKFDWNNLYWSCVHCNNTKLVAYNNILDCTDPNDGIEEKLHYSFNPFPYAKVKIEALDDNQQTQETRDLILAIFNGTTTLKSIEADNLRNKLLQEIQDFQSAITDYCCEPSLDASDKDRLLRKIKSHLHDSSSFTSFKRWIVRDNDRLNQEFGQYFQS